MFGDLPQLRYRAPRYLSAILRLLAVGEASRRLGDYARTLAAKYLALSAAGMIFLAAIIFGILAAFWALTSSIRDPVISAAIMAGALVSIGLLTVLAASGIGRKKTPGAKQALRERERAALSQVPSIEDVGQQIEKAARTYGPLRVTAAAAAGGLVTGLLASRFRPSGTVNRGPEHNARRHERMNRKNRRRYASGAALDEWRE